MAQFGISVRKLRQKRGWSQTELARRAGVSHPTVSQVERGVLAPTTETREAIARALGTAVDVAFTGFPRAKSEVNGERRAKLRADIAELYEAGKTDEAIGEELDVPQGTVSNNR